MKAGSGLSQGRHAEPTLAASAVAAAMEHAGLSHAQAVLLYLSADFARDPQPAITAAARAGNCFQVAGCTAAGVFSDADWVLDAPAAAALVLGEGPTLQAVASAGDPVLTFAAPNALDLHWLKSGGARFGGVSGDASGQGPTPSGPAGAPRKAGAANWRWPARSCAWGSRRASGRSRGPPASARWKATTCGR